MARTKHNRGRIFCWGRFLIHLAVIGASLVAAAGVQAAVTLNVRGVDNSVSPPTETEVISYRWVIEEDATYHVPFVGNVPQLDAETRAVNFHQSYMPVVAQGNTADPASTQLAEVMLDATKHYYVSVIPAAPGAYSIGGAALAPGQTSATVHLNKLPLPTAQITVFVFEDNAPINNAPDLPEELGMGGFQILVEDAGGRYGMSAGAQMADVYGNPLGTVYQQTCDASGKNPGTGSFGCLDTEGMPSPVLDAEGDPLVEPLITGPDGYLTIKNLAPGKYGIQAVPPAGSGYQQTSTIEGTRVIDAWVKANEPPYFAEFGPAGVHVFIGFVKPFIDSTVLNGGQTISGQVVNLHLSRPPESAFYNGAPFEHTTPWVGLNSNAGLAGSSVGLYVGRANSDGTFAIHNVPPGDYQLVVFDDALDVVFAFHGVTVLPAPTGGCVTPNGSCNLGPVPVFQWFTRLENWVFHDMNSNGLRDPGEMGIGEQAVNLRWRDGTMYQSAPTDMEGFVPFDQVFPFFAWQVAEVDFARFKATGVTVTVDDGGPIPFGTGGELLRDQLKPQPQNNPPDSVANFYSAPENRTELGPVLSQAFQGFLGQTSVLEWGKKSYEPGENGGISGIVFYSTTRAEDDPKYGVGEPWEPGIPRVTVNLWDHTGTVLLNSTTTDSWDDSRPTNCQYGSSDSEPFTYLGVTRDCYDGMRNWNQVRPGVFDGGYAFSSIFVDAAGNPVPLGTADATETEVIPPGEYIVEVIPPTGYEVVKSQDRNVDFGDNYIPAPHLLPPECVGTSYTVPAELSLFPGTPAALAGQSLPLCDRKQVFLSDKANAAADFFLFTQVPIAGHIFGIILDDTANEFDPNSPQFGEKYAPPFMPVGIYDWTGRLIGQTYSDQFGRFDALVPSTYTANLPQPSGMSPNMLTTCMNDSNPLADPKGLHNQQYSSFCYNFNYMPGATTYLDTPVVPVAAFAGPDQAPLDCEYPAGTPRIYSVSAPNSGGGPYVPATGANRVLTITSMGTVSVLNPEYDGSNAKTIPRDYGFGTTPGTVRIGSTALTNVTWGAGQITATVPAGTTTGQLTVTRGDNGQSTVVGVTVHVGLNVNGNNPQTLRRVSPGPGAIQTAIDAAGPRDLILVSPGVYDEMVILWKPVRLQGWGEGSTRINAIKVPTNKLQAWRSKVEGLITSGAVNLLPGQEVAFGGIEPGTLFAEEGAGVLVLATSSTANSPTSTGFGNNRNRGARIDGFTIASADTGGGIVVNGYAPYLEITNNRIVNNSGFYGGGIRIGHPTLTDDANNDFIRISNNHIAQNGGLNGAGGGVSMCTGADSYQISSNYICGNFTLGNGGGIGHLGLSTLAQNNAPSPLIKGNKILFNQSFNQGVAVSGGGIFIGGQAVLTGLTPGAGTVTIDGNLIQGNQAGAGDGGGIQLLRTNGQDVGMSGNQPNNWYRINILNNMIVNNLSGLAGAGIALQDAPRTFINHNTVANNDSTATAAGAFSPGTPNSSNPQPAGIVSRAHSVALNNAIGNVSAQYKAPFSNPTLVDNIVWHNRSFYFASDPGATPPMYGLLPPVAAPVFDDLAVLGTATPACLSPRYNLLTNLSEDPACNYGAAASGNLAADPAFVLGYFNGGRGTTVTPGEETTALAAPAAFDEGGNFIQVRFGPLTPVSSGGAVSNYHILTTSPAINSGTAATGFVPGETLDYDGQTRPLGGLVDIGADEMR